MTCRKEGDYIYYITKDNKKVKAKIIKIHHDDVEPYFTIKVKGENVERQTVESRIKTRKKSK